MQKIVFSLRTKLNGISAYKDNDDKILCLQFVFRSQTLGGRGSEGELRCAS
jgi:hypothetical protein